MFPLSHMVLGCGATGASQRLLGNLQGSACAIETSRRAVDPTDYRLVVIGAMLPDAVDKPLGIHVLRKKLRSGSIHCSASAVSWPEPAILTQSPGRYPLV